MRAVRVGYERLGLDQVGLHLSHFSDLSVFEKWEHLPDQEYDNRHDTRDDRDSTSTNRKGS
jgi:hypothetical protein